MRFYPLEKLINLEDGYSRQFKIDNLHLLLLQQQGERYLIEATCPHKAHPLATATIRNDVIECPLHKYQFSLKGGQLLHHTEQPCRAMRVWELTYEGNEIGVMLGDEEERFDA